MLAGADQHVVGARARWRGRCRCGSGRPRWPCGSGRRPPAPRRVPTSPCRARAARWSRTRRTSGCPAALTISTIRSARSLPSGPATMPHASSGWSRLACATIASYVAWSMVSMTRPTLGDVRANPRRGSSVRQAMGRIRRTSPAALLVGPLRPSAAPADAAEPQGELRRPGPRRSSARRVTTCSSVAPVVDVVIGLGGDDTIRGLGGDDLLCGGAGHRRGPRWVRATISCSAASARAC